MTIIQQSLKNPSTDLSGAGCFILFQHGLSEDFERIRIIHRKVDIITNVPSSDQTPISTAVSGCR